MKPLLWIAVALMLPGAAMLVTGIGAPALWIAVITVGIALVVVDRVRPRATPRRGRVPDADSHPAEWIA